MNCNIGLLKFPANGKMIGMITNVNIPKYTAPYVPKIYIF